MEQRHFDRELLELKEKLLLMAAKAEQLIRQSLEALIKKDAVLAQSLFALDKEVDKLEIEIEEDAIALIARHQPAAGDLRFLIGAIKINNDLERISDHGVNIAQSAIRLAAQPDLKPLIDIPRMAELSIGMLKDSLDSFVNNDAEKARAVCKSDDQVDDLKDQIFRELLTFMMEKPDSISRAMDLILVSRNLERVADLSTNISEEEIYISEAKIIKHHAQAAE
ncbi:phosphate signaling complex protein PhoU [candidate division TA06 bacterium]|uniref:Phosphate-specific transport system accessory protein PhoU n=1 Tax=candidate division TA06 bacterium TaxID=2250710 RepID=A0A933MK21_UNCT6|nr:phosphate signaling complex protein PhoU [candidate division TA06 bacterium]